MNSKDTPTEEDLDFIVDDEDPADYIPNDDKYIVSGKDFKKLTRNAKKLGAESLDYSTRKNNKYMATLPSGKKVHFGSPNYPDYTILKDKDRRDKYLARAKKIKNKQFIRSKLDSGLITKWSREWGLS